MAIEFEGQQYEEHNCPHCGQMLKPWIAPPESGWGVILVCCNNECSFFKGSDQDILNKRDDSHLGCRYAVDPDNHYRPFHLLAWCPSC